MSNNQNKKKVAVLTGGGCAPGLDPFLESFARKMNSNNYQVLGIEAGWKGLMSTPPNIIELYGEQIEGLTRSGCTSIGTSRENPYKDKDDLSGEKTVLENLKALGVEGLVAFGGDDTLTVANKLSKAGANVISIPKTMDLDLSGTDYSVGFWSYNEAVFKNATPGFIDTLKSHQRVGVLEVFGRHSGFTAVVVGITGGACYIAIPEMEVSFDQLRDRVKEFYNKHKWALVVVGEAVNLDIDSKKELDEHDNEFLFNRQTGKFLAKTIEKLTGIEARSFQCTHPYRGVPTAYDSFIGFRMGVKAARMVLDEDWGRMVSVRGENVITEPIADFKPRRIIEKGSFWHQLVALRNQGVA